MIQDTIDALVEADQDFEWYPTTQTMINVVASHLDRHCNSILDIGAGDGRVLTKLATEMDRDCYLYAIEKSQILLQSMPDNIVPVGTEFFEQNLACLQVDVIFCNPPYSQYELWASRIIESGYAESAFLVIPRRWHDSKLIAEALKRRGAKAKTIHSDNFFNGERKARAEIEIVEITYPRTNSYSEKVLDPFDIWFDQNIDCFEPVEEVSEDECENSEMAKHRVGDTIKDMVEAYLIEYNRMEENYRAIFKLDHQILTELGVSKDNVREGIKTKMKGLKNKYWQMLFEKLDAITSRLCTKTKESFLSRLTNNTSVAFTAINAYAVVMWAIKNANKYYDEQLITLFRELATFETVHNYKSNQKTWERNGWRYSSEDHSHYALDYRIVVGRYTAIKRPDDYMHMYDGNLSQDCHELIADIIAVFSNLGFVFSKYDTHSRRRQWYAGEWQDFVDINHEVIFQVKGHLNGNLHFRFKPDAIKRFNVEAGRLLGWLQNVDDVVRELGYSEEEAKQYFESNLRIAPANVKLLTAEG